MKKGTLAQLKALRTSLLIPKSLIIVDAASRIAELAFSFEFAGVVDAVRGAVEIQRDMAQPILMYRTSSGSNLVLSKTMISLVMG